MIDALTQFVFEGHGARGAIVDVRSGLQRMLGARDYSPSLRALLGEAIAVSPLLASHLKFSGRINLQFQGKGPVKLLVAQIDHRLKMRAMATAEAGAAGSFPELTGDGHLALMLEPNDGGQRYQALVPIEGETLAGALEGYYAQSEQLPTMLCLAASESRCCGLLLQRLPGRDQIPDTDYWEHLRSLMATLTPAEMLDVDAETLLRRLFHAEDLRVFEPRAVELACSCSHASISQLMLALGESELEPELKAHGRVSVTCEFCGQVYEYPELEIRELFAASRQSPGPLRH